MQRPESLVGFEWPWTRATTREGCRPQGPLIGPALLCGFIWSSGAGTFRRLTRAGRGDRLIPDSERLPFAEGHAPTRPDWHRAADTRGNPHAWRSPAYAGSHGVRRPTPASSPPADFLCGADAAVVPLPDAPRAGLGYSMGPL